MDERYDAIVVGVGGVGSAATYHLADRGLDVLGLERFDVPNTRGSSHGGTRIVRRAQHEGPGYVPLADRAYELWRELETETGRDLLHRTGSVHACPPDGDLVADATRACESHGVPHETLDGAAANDRFPGYDLPPDYRVLHQPDGGFLAVERCTVAHAEAALAAGATVRGREAVTDWTETGDGVRVDTERGRYGADELVVTAGPWTRDLLPGLAADAEPVRAVTAWFRPERPSAFDPDRFPVFVLGDGYGDDDIGGYGVPRFERPGFKVGLARPRPAIDPDDPAVQPTRADAERHRRFVERYFPEGAGSTLSLSTCIWTMSRDEHFLLGRPAANDAVTVGAGFSGHGYKFASALGEVLADLAVDGATAHDLTTFALDR